MEHTCVGEDDDVTHTHLFINTYIHAHTYTYQHQLFSKIQVDILVAERHYKTLFLDATLSCEPLLYHTTEDTAILTSPGLISVLLLLMQGLKTSLLYTKMILHQL